MAAGGALVGLAAASLEIGINISSAITGLSDIGLGTMLGSNVIAIPIMVVTAYLATRHLKKKKVHKGHQQHLQEHLLKVDPTAVTIQANPYLVIVGVVAVLTVPAPWRGLQAVAGSCWRYTWCIWRRHCCGAAKKGKKWSGKRKKWGWQLPAFLCWDKAVAESFFKTLKVECVYDYRFESQQDAATTVFEYIEVWYNRKRLHSSLGYRTPAQMEQLLNQYPLVA